MAYISSISNCLIYTKTKFKYQMYPEKKLKTVMIKKKKKI